MPKAYLAALELRYECFSSMAVAVHGEEAGGYVVELVQRANIYDRGVYVLIYGHRSR
jgi:hypothetical protein